MLCRSGVRHIKARRRREGIELDKGVIHIEVPESACQSIAFEMRQGLMPARERLADECLAIGHLIEDLLHPHRADSLRPEIKRTNVLACARDTSQMEAESLQNVEWNEVSVGVAPVVSTRDHVTHAHHKGVVGRLHLKHDLCPANAGVAVGARLDKTDGQLR